MYNRNLKIEKSIKHDNDKAFSSIDLVCQCLIDSEKANAFENALKNVMKPNFFVIDIGTGSGILALLAARTNAKKVTALEFDDYIADVARNNIKINGYDEKISVVCDDARTIDFSTNTYFDVVVMEMLTTGMVDEFQVQAINNLHKQKVVDEKTVFIPARQETYVTLANTNFENYGLNMKMVRHLWKHDKNDGIVNSLSDKVLLNKVDFSQIIDEFFSISLSIPINKDGEINSIYLTSKTIVDNFNYLESTHSLNASVAVPLPEREVKKGEIVKVNIKYRYGYGYGQFNVNII
jgi:predicted RNA methylase